MKMQRRGFLGLLAAGLAVTAPAIIRTPGLIMPVKPVLGLPEKKIIRAMSVSDLRPGDLVNLEVAGIMKRMMVTDLEYSMSLSTLMTARLRLVGREDCHENWPSKMDVVVANHPFKSVTDDGKPITPGIVRADFSTRSELCDRVHDSFIVRQRHEATLEVVVNDTFQS